MLNTVSGYIADHSQVSLIVSVIIFAALMLIIIMRQAQLRVARALLASDQAALVQARQELMLRDQQASFARQQFDELGARADGLETDLDEKRSECQRKDILLERLETTLQSEARRYEDLQEKLAESKTQLKQEFHQLANEIFEAKQKNFYQQSQQSLDAVLKPFKEQVFQFRQKVEEIYQSDARERTSLKTEVKMLQELNQKITVEAENLSNALTGNKKAQGNWGEMLLETVLEKSGLREGKEFEREVVFSEDGRRSRPDVIICLPDNKQVIVDAKVSLLDYMRYINADDPEIKKSALKAHIAAVRNHVKRLSEKSYQHIHSLNSPDFVFMFMPIESAFVCAFEHDDTMFNDAFDSHIVVVTPTTLLAALRTISNLWSLEQQNQHARALVDRGAKLYDKLRMFTETMVSLGQQIDTTQKSYHQAMGRLKHGNGNIVSQAQKFIDLGIRVKKEIPSDVLDSADLIDEDDNVEPESLAKASGTI